MRITFNPPLGQSVVVPVVPYADTTRVRFTAKVHSNAEWLEYKQGGLKLQIWSDAPAEGRQEGKWGEFTFQAYPPVQDSKPKPSGTTLSLSTKPPKVAPNDSNTLQAEIIVPTSHHTRCSYTYRLIHPSGRIEWLGQYKGDGTFSLGDQDPRVHLSNGWSTQPGNGAYLWDTAAHPTGDNVVVRLSKAFECSIWAIDNKLFLEHDRTHSSLVAIIPTLDPLSISQLQSFIVSASEGAYISVNRRDELELALSGQGSLLLQAWDSRTDLGEFVRRALSHCSLSEDRLIHSDSNLGHIVLTSSPSKYPVSTLIIPFIPRPAGDFAVTLQRQQITRLLPNTPDFCAFAPTSSSYRFFSSSDSEPLDEEVPFASPGNGGTFLLAPVYSLDEGRTWLVSVLTSYSVANSSETLEQGQSRPHSPSPSANTNGHHTPVSPDAKSSPSSLVLYPRASLTRREFQLDLRRFVSYLLTLLLMYLRTLFSRFWSTSAIMPFAQGRRPANGSHVSPGVTYETAASSEELPETVSPSPSDDSPKCADRDPPQSLSVYVVGGKVSVLLRHTGESATLEEEVGIELGGEAVPYTVKPIDQTTYAIGLKAGHGGARLMVFLLK